MPPGAGWGLYCGSPLEPHTVYRADELTSHAITILEGWCLPGARVVNVSNTKGLITPNPS